MMAELVGTQSARPLLTDIEAAGKFIASAQMNW
jgi:hypothetical protein